jgi:hypothetical protein
MRYCNQCHRITIGEPLFCNFCGSSYDVKLCPHRHINPRVAEVCSQCGSRDLSTPAPQVNALTTLFLYLVSIFPGIILLLVTALVLIGFVQAFVTSQQIQLQFLIIMLLLGFVWFIYMHLPSFIRSLMRTLWHKTKKDGHN